MPRPQRPPNLDRSLEDGCDHAAKEAVSGSVACDATTTATSKAVMAENSSPETHKRVAKENRRPKFDTTAILNSIAASASFPATKKHGCDTSGELTQDAVEPKEAADAPLAKRKRVSPTSSRPKPTPAPKPLAIATQPRPAPVSTDLASDALPSAGAPPPESEAAALSPPPNRPLTPTIATSSAETRSPPPSPPFPFADKWAFPAPEPTRWTPITLCAPFPANFVKGRRFPTKAELDRGDMLNPLDLSYYHGRTWTESWWKGLSVNTYGSKTEVQCEECADEGGWRVLHGCKVLRNETGRGGRRGGVKSCGNCLFSGLECSFKEKK